MYAIRSKMTAYHELARAVELIAANYRFCKESLCIVDDELTAVLVYQRSCIGILYTVIISIYKRVRGQA